MWVLSVWWGGGAACVGQSYWAMLGQLWAFVQAHVTYRMMYPQLYLFYGQILTGIWIYIPM